MLHPAAGCVQRSFIRVLGLPALHSLSVQRSSVRGFSSRALTKDRVHYRINNNEIFKSRFLVPEFDRRYLCSEHDEKPDGEAATVVDTTLSRYEAIATLDSLLKTEPMMMFMKGSPSDPKCKHSGKMRDLLLGAGVDVVPYVNVLKYPMIRETIKEMSLYPNIPQLFVKGEFLGGVDDIAEMIEKNKDEFVSKLKAAGVVFMDEPNPREFNDGGPVNTS